MRLLAVDTALGACSVAVIDAETTLAHRWAAMPRGHAEALAPMVSDAMREAGLGFTALDRLAVTTGPGTFTGQRVGLAFMRGLRIALGRPLVGVTTLDAMAAAASDEAGIPLAAALHEAKRGEVYGALYRQGTPILPVQVERFEAMMAKIAAELAKAHGRVALAGTAAEAAADWLRERPRTEPVLTSIRQPDALWVARLALHLPAPKGAPAPLYLRSPDAKLARTAITVRPAVQGEAGILASLHAASMPDAWNEDFFELAVVEPHDIALIAEAGGVALGLIICRVAADEAEILTVAVLEGFRQNGGGRKLLRAAAARAAEIGAKSLYLEVAEDNLAARRLYESEGFSSAGRRQNYYGKGRDALLLRATLPLSTPPLGFPPKLA